MAGTYDAIPAVAGAGDDGGAVFGVRGPVRALGGFARVPRVLPPSPTLAQVMDAVNVNSSRVRTLACNRATLNVQGFPTLWASVAFERPQRFRLRALTPLTGPELDLGSNDELFWLWLHREQPPTLFYCRHDQFAGSARSAPGIIRNG